MKRTDKDIERMLNTLLALWVLQNVFEEYLGEWQMIAAKAKAYLKSRNVKKPNKLISACSA